MLLGRPWCQMHTELVKQAIKQHLLVVMRPA